MAARTELAYLTEPARRTLLATVEGTRGPAFVLDRSIYYATSHAYRHPQPADRGDVWIGGDKRVLTRVFWDRSELRHVVRGVTPAKGTRVNCHLDAGRRDVASAAHTALHLVLSAFARRRLGVFTTAPVVQGGGRFTVAARWNAWSPSALKALLDAVNEAAARKLEVGVSYRPRDSLRDVDPQPFSDGVTHPGPQDVVRIVHVGDASVLPCDGTLLKRTGALGRIVAADVRPSAGELRVQFRAS